MLNVGLKDVRPKPEITSDILRMRISTGSTPTLSLGGVDLYITMEASGSSTAVMSILSIDYILMETSGASDVSMRLFREPTGKPTKEILTFVSEIILDVEGESPITISYEGKSKIIKEVTINSEIDD